MDELNQNENLEPTGDELSPGTPAEVLEASGTPEGSDDAGQTKADDGGAGDDDVVEPKPEKDRIQDRIDEITRKRREAEREAAYWKGRAEGATPKIDALPTAPVIDPMAPFSEPRPVEDDFETLAEYEEADRKHLVAQARYEARQEMVREDVRRQAEKAEKELREKVAGWFKNAPANLPDFQAIVCKPPEQGGPAFSMEMIEIWQDSPVGHQLAYELAKNPEEVWRLRNLPPHRMAMELARREQKLSVAPAQPKKITSAPNPITPVTPAATAVNKTLEDMPTDEFMARRDREQFGPNWKG
ncbi:MAG: hypothetical protein WC593_15085 [Methanoregula sp.]